MADSLMQLFERFPHSIALRTVGRLLDLDGARTIEIEEAPNDVRLSWRTGNGPPKMFRYPWAELDLPVLGELAPDALGLEHAEELGLIRHVGAGSVAEAVAAAAELLVEQIAHGGRVLVVDAQLLAHALVPQLRQRLGAGHSEP